MKTAKTIAANELFAWLSELFRTGGEINVEIEIVEVDGGPSSVQITLHGVNAGELAGLVARPIASGAGVGSRSRKPVARV